MKIRTIAICLLILMASLSIAVATDPLEEPLYCVYGFVYVDGVPTQEITVTLASRGEQITGTTANDGSYAVGVENLPSIYQEGDTITVSATYNGKVDSYTFTGNTVNAPQRVDLHIVTGSDESSGDDGDGSSGGGFIDVAQPTPTPAQTQPQLTPAPAVTQEQAEAQPTQLVSTPEPTKQEQASGLPGFELVLVFAILVAVFAIVIIGLFLMIFRRRRKRKI